MRTLRSLAAFGAALFVAFACAQRAPDAVLQTEGLRVSISVAPNPPATGENRLRIVLDDGKGQPVAGAHVALGATMPPMGAMGEMKTRGELAERGAGVYEVRFELAMSGTWNLDLEVHAPGGATITARGSVTTGTKGVRFETEGGAGTGAVPAPAGEHGGHGAAVPAAVPGEIRIDPARLQTIGVRSEVVASGAFDVPVRAVGRIVPDETRLVDVSLRTRGFVQELRADALGAHVGKGDVLLTVYGPELYTAQVELRQALASQRGASLGTAPGRADALVTAAKQRLRLWGIADADVAALARDGEVKTAIPIRAPVSGVIVEKDVVAGAAVEPGTRLYRIAPLDRVWLEAEIYDADIPLVKAGQEATIEAPALPGRTLTGRVAYVYPTVDAATRTAKLRIELANEDGALKPEMYATATLHAAAGGDRISVPTSAVIYTGPRRLVFVDLGEGRLAPREVTVGARTGERIEVLAGLAPGERVVTSGNFLLAAESRLRSAEGSW